MRVPTSRWSAAAASYVAAARAKARRTARGSTSRGSGAGKLGVLIEKRADYVAECVAMRQERRVRRALHLRITRARNRGGEPRAGGSRRQRVALPCDDERRSRDDGGGAAQVGVDQDRQHRVERRGPRCCRSWSTPTC